MSDQVKQLSHHYCHYSDLPSPLAYMDTEAPASAAPAIDTDRVIEMAWEDRTPFEAIKWQFGLSENDVKALMKRSLRPGSYRAWRRRVESSRLKHLMARTVSAVRFKSRLQRHITSNKISKRRRK